MIDNTSLLLQVIGLLTIIAETSGSGGGSGGAVTVDNFPTDYSLETTQQTSISTLTDILTELQSLVTNTTSPLSVTESNPITGFNLEATQQDVLKQLQDLLTELQKSKNIETTIFVDTNENPDSSNYIVFRDSIYDTTSATYVDNYYKIDDFGVKIPFDAGLSAGIFSVDTAVVAQLNFIAQAVASSPGGFVNGSGSIAVANTSQQVFNSSNGRSYLLIQNISDTDMYINFGSVANIGAGSIKLVPNGSYELIKTVGGYMNTQEINIICSIAGKEFTAKAT